MQCRYWLIGLGMFWMSTSVWAAPDELYATANNHLYKIPFTYTYVDGLNPRGLAYDNAGNLYVSDPPVIWKFTPSGRKSIYASDLSVPESLAFDSVNNLYVGTGSGIVSISPAGTKVVLDNVVATGLAFSKAGDLYVTTGNSILLFPMGHGPPSTVTNSLTAPNSLVTDSSGNLYVGLPGNGSPGNGSIFKISIFGSTFASGLTNPQGLAFDSAGNLYEVEPNGTINKFTPAGVQTQFSPPSATQSDCRGLAFDGAGNLLVADFLNTIHQYDAAANHSVFYYGLNDPRDIAFDAMGILYLAENEHGFIFRYLPDGTRTIFASGLSPVGLRVNSAGILFEADSDGSINKFSPNGTKTTFATQAPNSAFAIALAFDSTGNLFEADLLGNSIYKFDPSGMRTLFTTSVSKPRGLAMDAFDRLYETDTPIAPATFNRFTSSGVKTVFDSTAAGFDVAIDSAGNVYLASLNGILKYTSPNFTRSTWADNGGYFIAFEPKVTFAVTAITHLATGHNVITGKGAPNYTYSVQYSADLSGPFVPIPNATATANASGVMQYDDASHPTSTRAFYRFSYP